MAAQMNEGGSFSRSRPGGECRLSDGGHSPAPTRLSLVGLRPRRARISQAANERYLDALAEVHARESLGDLTKSLCQPTELNGKRVRALQPWSPGDAQLLEAVSRPEFLLNGFRNAGVRGRFPAS